MDISKPQGSGTKGLLLGGMESLDNIMQSIKQYTLNVQDKSDFGGNNLSTPHNLAQNNSVVRDGLKLEGKANEVFHLV